MLYWTGYITLKVDGVSTTSWQRMAELARKSDCILILENVGYLSNLLLEVLLLTFMNFYARYFDISNFIQWSTRLIFWNLTEF